MSREELRTASEELAGASADIDDPDASERLERLAGQLERLAGRDHGPDHGRLDRIQHALAEISETARGEPLEAIQRASERISAYRETVEGV